jgi:hypothetical protein
MSNSRAAFYTHDAIAKGRINPARLDVCERLGGKIFTDLELSEICIPSVFDIRRYPEDDRFAHVMAFPKLENSNIMLPHSIFFDRKASSAAIVDQIDPTSLLEHFVNSQMAGEKIIFSTDREFPLGVGFRFYSQRLLNEVAESPQVAYIVTNNIGDLQIVFQRDLAITIIGKAAAAGELLYDNKPLSFWHRYRPRSPGFR